MNASPTGFREAGGGMGQLKRLLGWMAPYRLRIIASLLLMAVVAALTVVTVWLIKPLFDEGLFAPNVVDRHAAYMMVVRLAVVGLIATAVWAVIFIGVAMWRFQREDF